MSEGTNTGDAGQGGAVNGSESTSESTEAVSQSSTEGGDLSHLSEADRAYVQKLRSEAASWRTKYQTAKPFEDKARQLEESQKTEAQRLAEATTAAEQRAIKAEARLARIDAAREAGLDLTLADRIVGETPEQMLEDARVLAERFSQAGGSVTRRPAVNVRETVNGGAATDDANLSPSDLAKKVRERSSF